MTAVPRSKIGEAARWLPGLILSLVAILLLLQLADWREVFVALGQMEIAWLFPAMFFYIGGIFFRGLTWRTLLQNEASLGRTLITLNEGYLLNNVLPFRLGEVGRVLLLSQAAEISPFFVLSTILIERGYDLALAAGLLLGTIPLVLALDSARVLALAVVCAVGLGMVALYISARSHRRIKVFLEGAKVSGNFYRQRLLPWLDSLLTGLGVLTRLDRFLLSFFFILASWLFGAVEIHILITSFGYSAPWWWTGFVLGVVSLGIAVPSAPASLGVYEAAMVGAFSILGVPAAAALAIAVLAHLIHLVFTGTIGAIGLFRDGETLSGIYQRLRNTRLLGNR